MTEAPQNAPSPDDADKVGGMAHDWFHPYAGSNLRCRNCGLWTPQDDGEPCPGPRDWPQPTALINWYEDDIPERLLTGEVEFFTARMRVRRDPEHGDIRFMVEEVLDE